MFFFGPNTLTLDTKGRIMMPVKHRDALMAGCGGRLYITRHPDGCLLLLPAPVWEKMVEQIMGWGEDLSLYRQIYFSSAEEVTWDAAGRILIPAALRIKAKLEKEVDLLGNGTHFRIWNAQILDALEEEIKLNKSYPDAVKNLNI